MRLGRLVVPVLVALSGLGWAAAHALAHTAVMSERTMSETGANEYLGYLPTSLALCLALALPLAAGAALGRRWRGASARSLWLFGAVPVLGFAGPELVESGGPGSASRLAPIVLVGLVVQIPVALVAVGLARRVLLLAESCARTLARPSGAPARRPAERYPRPGPVRLARVRIDLAHSQRGPPPLPA